MEFNYEAARSRQGGWHPESNQDFRQGAKGLDSLHPVSFSSEPASSIHDGHLDEWMEVRETLGYSGLEAFDDVIIPDVDDLEPCSFETRDYLEENANIDSKFNLFNHYTGTNESSYGTITCSRPGTEEPTSNVTIKLKRIVVPKKIPNLQDDFFISDYEIAGTPQRMEESLFQEISCDHPQANNIFSYDTAMDISNCSDIIKTVDITDGILNEDSFTIEEDPLDIFINGNCSPNLTLKEALSLDNADSIIENYLVSGSQSNSPLSSPLHETASRLSLFHQSPKTERWSNSPFTEVPEEIFSPSTSNHQSPVAERWSNSPLPEEIFSPSTSNHQSPKTERWSNSPRTEVAEEIFSPLTSNHQSPVAERWSNSPLPEEIFSPSTSNHQSPVRERWSNSPLTEVPEEIFSPSTSSYYYSEEIPSPSNSDYYFRESVTPEPSSASPEPFFASPEPFFASPEPFSASPEPFSVGGTALQRPRKSKLKKQREKMSQESRYLRKKEQNKQAALRYRAKKKQEDEILLKSLQEEEETNARLDKEHENLMQEIKFMKKLMRETFITKKLVPPNAFD